MIFIIEEGLERIFGHFRLNGGEWIRDFGFEKEFLFCGDW